MSPLHLIRYHRSQSGLVAALALVLPTCSLVTSPSLPANALPFQPPRVYNLWWSMTQQCSGLTGNLTGVRWYRAPAREIEAQRGRAVDGFWTSTGNRIVMADEAYLFGRAVRHEMLHALYRRGGHPRQQFLDRCGGVVDCETYCVADAGSVTLPPAPQVSPSTLEVAAVVSPASPSSQVNDGFFDITLTVRNPAPTPVHVSLPSSGASFGIRLADSLGVAIASVPSWDSPAIAFFEPGQIKRFVFDLVVLGPPGRLYVGYGSYEVRVAFAEHWSAPVRFVVRP